MTDCTVITNLYLPITTALISGGLILLGVWLSNRSSAKLLALQLDRAEEKEKKENLRIRLEELYEVSGKWANSYVSHHALFRLVMDAEITYNDALDIQIERNTDDSASRMFTLGELYFTEYNEQLSEIKRLRDLASSIQSDFKEHYRSTGLSSNKHSEAITDVLELSVIAIDTYRSALSKHTCNV